MPRHLLHPLTPAFSAVLRRLRAKRRMSRYRLGKLANVSREWVAKIEEGACAFTIDLVARLCEALGHPFESVAAQAARHRRRNAR